ncbi:MAG: zinc-ribbon domain-containing protein [Polyangiaceae bacterium]|jgi:ribosomal protein L40E
MQCTKCGTMNPDGNVFCRSCGARGAPRGEPGAAPATNVAPPDPSAKRCPQCGGSRTLPGAVGPALGVRVFTSGRHDDLPLAEASVCVDCGHVSMSVPDDARRYLAGLVGG